MRRERLVAAVFALLLGLTAAHFVQQAWLRTEMIEDYLRAHPPVPVGMGPPASPKLYAPAAYRVLIPALVSRMQGIFSRAAGSTLLATIDAVCLPWALWLLYRVTADRFHVSKDAWASRGAGLVLTMLFCSVALLWLPQYQRPETTPTALYLALSMMSVQRGASWLVVVQLLGTVLQALMRADVPVCLGTAMLIASWLSNSPGTYGRRKRLLWQGLATVVIGGCIQLYLQMVKFPHLSYDPKTPMVALSQNLHVHLWSNAALALAPVSLALVWSLRRDRQALRFPEDALALAAAAIYLPLWAVMGLLVEVRIFLPFLLMLSPLAGRATGRAIGWIHHTAVIPEVLLLLRPAGHEGRGG